MITMFPSVKATTHPVPDPVGFHQTVCSGGGLVCLALYTLLVMHVNVPHLPGAGMMVPQVPLAWMLAAGLMMVAGCAPERSLMAALCPTPFMLLCLAAVVILTLPLLYAAQTWRYLAEERVAGLWGGLLLMMASRALFTTPSLRNTVLVLILAGCVLEALIGIAQVLHLQSLPFWLTSSDNGRAYGVFRQPNVMASMVGTGVFLAWRLLDQACCQLTRVLVLISTFILAFCLPLTQSTQIWLTLALVLVCLPLFHRPEQRGWLCVLVAGLLVGQLVWAGLHGNSVDHSYGRYGRLQMWWNCLWLIMHRPWLGWGYGHFDMAYVYAWQTNGNTPAIDLAYTLHPHNELLYWLTEGGMVAGVGISLLIAAGISLLRRSLQARKSSDLQTQASGMEALSIALCALPVLIHTQVEWPLYLSAWHYLMMVMLLALADAALQQATTSSIAPGDVLYTADTCTVTPRRVFCAPLAILLMISGTTILWWMITGLTVGLQLTLAASPDDQTVDRLHTVEVVRTYNPWVLKEEVWRTEAVVQANRAYQTGDLSLLLPVIDFEEQYLLRHPDLDITANLIKHLRLSGQVEKARTMQMQGHAMAPWDARFSDSAQVPDFGQQKKR
ncbi:O-antigen ligase family protein [Enterobacter ludwigii]|uniref:O-antigen ligase family protein n=1 Tax=Enterobacter ludwigii TaxID=299767 RepID=UPI001865E4A3|nr:Wzy polymerase domain-containing protein [Enterobacter ludwigii]